MTDQNAIKILNLQLTGLFGNQKFVLQSMPAWFPEQILKFFETFDNDCDLVIIQDELWRYNEINNIVLNYDHFRNKQIYVAKLGYQNVRINERISYLSYPWPFMWGNLFNKANNFDFKPDNLSFGFNCLNNRTAVHRLLLGAKLHKENLLSQVLFTQNNFENVDNNLPITPDLEDFLSKLPLTLPDEPIPKNRHLNTGPIVYHSSFYNAYCNIVTETETEEYPYTRNINLECITEKSYKPFVAKQIPLYLACRGHLAYLKSLGFEVMETLYPKNFDSMGTEEKVQSIVEVVARGRDFIRDFYFDHIQEIQHNHDWYFSGNVQKLIFQRIKEYVG